MSVMRLQPMLGSGPDTTKPNLDPVAQTGMHYLGPGRWRWWILTRQGIKTASEEPNRETALTRLQEETDRVRRPKHRPKLE